jgi:hypothetical protein
MDGKERHVKVRATGEDEETKEEEDSKGDGGAKGDQHKLMHDVDDEH